MMRSLSSGVAGMRAHQTRMDVIGSNIANVNTVGFKKSRVTFTEALVQTMRGATRPSATLGGRNPMQVGLGVQVGSIDTIFTQGFLENTGVVTDLAIEGDGFFIVGDGQNRLFTRSGNFIFDATGRLVSSSTGLAVQGVMARPDGTIPPLTTLQDIVIPFDMQTSPEATTRISIKGNLDAQAAVGDTKTVPVSVIDSLGMQHVVTITFTKVGVNDWTWEATDPSGNPAGNGTAQFDADGRLLAFDGAGGTAPTISFIPTNGAQPMTINLEPFGAGLYDGLTQFAAPYTCYGRAEDGVTHGTLENIDIDSTGTIYGSFTNGIVKALARIAVATFDNPAGLERLSDGNYHVSVNSGEAAIQYPGDSGDVQIVARALEQSNVDLTEEFTSMITAQRGFQASARVITTTDEMLQELAMLKR